MGLRTLSDASIAVCVSRSRWVPIGEHTFPNFGEVTAGIAHCGMREKDNDKETGGMDKFEEKGTCKSAVSACSSKEHSSTELTLKITSAIVRGHKAGDWLDDITRDVAGRRAFILG